MFPPVARHLWVETQQVSVNNGVFNVLLGTATPIALAFDKQYYLGITVGNDPEMTPRQALRSAPYAIKAGCNAGDRVTCYTGAAGTDGTSLCQTGIRTCNAAGTAWSACVGEVKPNCGANCFNLQTDLAHCGACNIACAPASCAGGVASAPTCTAGVCGLTQLSCNGFACGITACLTSCAVDGDCVAGNFCVPGRPSICTPKQANGNPCTGANQCVAGICTGGLCGSAPAPTCTDDVKNGNETGVDCGGGTCTACANGVSCQVNFDCASGTCNPGSHLCTPSYP
jgi:hypothetical protein